MSGVSQKRKDVIALVLDMSDEEISRLRDYIFLQSVGFDEDEPPLTDDEFNGINIAEQEIAEGKGIPLQQVIKELLPCDGWRQGDFSGNIL
ncbi:MAG: hypothetical protein IJS39_07560 [Synergistaceae bacterium]|nr:hypothetical protein [Synergistaceae bacterium]